MRRHTENVNVSVNVAVNVDVDEVYSRGALTSPSVSLSRREREDLVRSPVPDPDVGGESTPHEARTSCNLHHHDPAAGPRTGFSLSLRERETEGEVCAAQRAA